MDDELWPSVHQHQPLALWSAATNNNDGMNMEKEEDGRNAMQQQPPGCNTPLACSPPSIQPPPLLSPPAHCQQQRSFPIPPSQHHQFMPEYFNSQQQQQQQFDGIIPFVPTSPSSSASASAFPPYWQSTPAAHHLPHNNLHPTMMTLPHQQQHSHHSSLFYEISPPPPYFVGADAAGKAHPSHQQQHQHFDPQQQQPTSLVVYQQQSMPSKNGNGTNASCKTSVSIGQKQSGTQQQHQQGNRTGRPEPPVEQQRRSMAAQQKVQQWQQFGTGAGLTQPVLQDSGVHSMSHSTANSVMSMSSLHPISCISGVSSLPDEFSSLQDHPYFRHIPASIRHEEPEKMRKVLPELIPLISDESEEIVLKALTILSTIARKDQELGMGLIFERRVVEELLTTLRTQKKNKRIASKVLRTLFSITCNEPVGRDLFVQTVEAHGTGCLQELVHCIGIQEYSCFKYALLTLHNLMTDARCGRKVIAYCCEMRVLTKILGWLDDKNEKFLHLVTDIVDKLMSTNSEQMAFFLALNGHQKLINMLAYCQQETPLWRAVKLLTRIVEMDPAKMVAAGLLEAAQKHLEHASQRLVRELLKCIRDATHVPCAGHNITPLLEKLLQLLGTNDLQLKEACTDILANLSANNAHNKAFLVNSGAIATIFQLLHELDALEHALGASTQRDGIQERALVLLKSLCTGNPRANQARQQLLTNDGHKRLLLCKLREQRSLPLLRRMLMLLQQLAQDVLDVPLLQFSLPVNNVFRCFPQLPDTPTTNNNNRDRRLCSFASQTVFLIQQAIVCSGAGTAMSAEMEEICQRCLDILRLLARNGALLEEIFVELMGARVMVREEGHCPSMLLPQVFACFYDQLAPKAIALIAELARIPEAAQRFQRDQHTLDSLEGWAHSDTHTAQLAFNSLQLISGCKSNGGDGNVGRQNVEDRDEEEDNEEEIGMDGSDRAQQHQIHTSKERESQQAQQLLEDNDGRELSTSIGVVNNSPVSAAAAVTQMDFSPAPIGFDGAQMPFAEQQQHPSFNRQQIRPNTEQLAAPFMANSFDQFNAPMADDDPTASSSSFLHPTASSSIDGFASFPSSNHYHSSHMFSSPPNRFPSSMAPASWNDGINNNDNNNGAGNHQHYHQYRYHPNSSNPSAPPAHSNHYHHCQ